MDKLEILKIYNHNTIGTCIDGHDVIVIGTGIAFKKHVGNTINRSDIEKVYAFSDRRKLQFVDLMQNCPYLFFQISQSIIKKGQVSLKRSFRDWLVITLTDHIYYAVERKKQGIPLPNLMLDEIRSLYPDEYKVGLWALKLIYKYTEVKLGIGEAAYIAIHLINATEGKDVESTKILVFSRYIIRIIEECLGADIPHDAPQYSRLMIHLKFLGRKILGQIETKEETLIDYKTFTETSPVLQDCLDKIREFIESRYQYHLSDEELLYLTIHLNRILKI